MKIEKWLGNEIRFIEIDGIWHGVAMDVAVALGYVDTDGAVRRHCKRAKSLPLDSTGQVRKMKVIPEGDIYRLIVRSQLESAIKFESWVMETILPELRKQSGLETYQAFRMMDKEHQKSAMGVLHGHLPEPSRKDFIKANTIANKAVSNKYGYEKMVKKPDMSPEMLQDRQPILDDIVSLMVTKEHFDLDLSVKDIIYDKYGE